MKIRLAIADKDQVYANKLIKYFNCNYSDKLEVYYFTEAGELKAFIGENKIDVIIAAEGFGIDVKEIPKKTAFAYFSDSVPIDTINGIRAVCKYQKIDLIYKEILSMYSEKTTNFGYRIKNDDSTRIITFLSCSGGTGSSTAAAACAINLARRTKNVLYLNLEKFGTSNIFFNAEGNFNLGDVIYSIKSKKPNLSLKLESTVKKDVTGVFFYDPSKVAMDVMEMNDEDIKKLFDELKISGGYDYIIVDTDFDFDKRSAAIFEYTDSIVFVSDGSDIANAKFNRAYGALEVLDEQKDMDILPKSALLYNKFSSKNSKFAEGSNLTVLGGIQKYECAATSEIAKQISLMQIFDQL